MAVDQRHKNGNWILPSDYEGSSMSWDCVQVEVLMDIRDELQSLNSLLRCSNFMAIPGDLRRIRLNTMRRKYEKRKAAAA